MAYKRQTRFSSYYSRNELTKVSVHWSSKASAYQIIFHKSGQWYPTKERFEKIRACFITFIDKLPYGEKEKVVSIDIVGGKEIQNWTYYISEKFIENFKLLVEMMPEDFELDFIGKPVGESFSSKFTPTEVWLDKFKEITGNDISNLDYSSSRSIYRKYCFAMHPDRNREDSSCAEKMSIFNEVWTNLEIQHFKTKKEPETICV